MCALRTHRDPGREAGYFWPSGVGLLQKITEHTWAFGGFTSPAKPGESRAAAASSMARSHEPQLVNTAHLPAHPTQLGKGSELFRQPHVLVRPVPATWGQPSGRCRTGAAPLPRHRPGRQPTPAAPAAPRPAQRPPSTSLHEPNLLLTSRHHPQHVQTSDPERTVPPGTCSSPAPSTLALMPRCASLCRWQRWGGRSQR